MTVLAYRGMSDHAETIVHPERLTVLLAEHRDEVYARLSADLRAAGCAVRRAERGVDVGRLYRIRSVRLFITSVFLPDQSGWLVAAKLRLSSPEIPIWLYTPFERPSGATLAEFVGVDQRIHYGGDLWRLSTEIVRLLPALQHDGAGRGIAWWQRSLRGTPGCQYNVPD